MIAESEVVRDEFDFSDLTEIEIPVTLKYKSKGVETLLKCVLREASEDAAAKYTNALVKCTKLAGGKPSAMEGIGDLEPLLLSSCLFTVDDDPTKNNKPVPSSVLRLCPARAIKKLYAKCKEISELGENDTVESLEKQIALFTKKLAKLKAESVPNGQDSTETTSD